MSPRRPTVVALDTVNLGDRSYIVALDGQAVVVDPQRDIDRLLAILEQNAWTVTHVVETHVHNDYVSGGLVLAGELGAEYVVPRGHDYRFDATQVADGSTFTSGPMAWRVLHTPGHTPHHVSYAVAVDGVDAGVFTGGSMLYGSVGRPDLIGPDATEGLAHAQWHSMRKIVDEVAAGRRRVPHARLRLVLLGHEHGGDGLDRRSPGAEQSGAADRRGRVRQGADRRA